MRHSSNQNNSLPIAKTMGSWLLRHVVCRFSLCLIGVIPTTLFAATYTLTTAGAGTAQTPANWNTGGGGGGGTAAANFTTANDIFIIALGTTGTFTGNATFAAGVTLRVDGILNESGSNTTVTINGIVNFTATNTTQTTLPGGGNTQIFTLGAGALFQTANVNGVSGANCATQLTATKAQINLSTTADYQFNGAASSQAVLGMPATIRSLLITGGGGQTVTLGQNTTMTGALTVNAASTLAMSTFTLATPTSITMQTVGGGNGASITGSGALTLGGNITVNYTGSGAVTTGASIAPPTALGASRTISVTGDGTNGNTEFTMSGIISGAAFGITKTGTGTMLLTGANSYTGTTTISGGTLMNGAAVAVSTNGPFGNAASAIVMGDANTTTNNWSPSLLINGAFTVARTITIANQATTGTYSIGGNTDNNAAFSGLITFSQPLSVLQVATTSTNTLTISGGISGGLAGAKTVTVNNVGAVTVSTTAISSGTGTTAVTKQNSGILTMNVANTYTAGTTLTAGTLKLSNASGLGAAGQAVALNGGILDLEIDASVNAYNITVGGATTISSDKATAASAGITHTLGTLSIGAFVLTISGGNNVTSGTAGINFGSVTHTAAPTYTVNDPTGGGITQLSVAAVANSTFLTTFNGDGNVIQTGVFGNGSGGIAYSGTGMITLNQANTFTGGVTLSSGTLNVNSATALGTVAGTFTVTGGTVNNTNAGAITNSANNPIALNGDLIFTGTQNLNLGTGTVTSSGSRQITVSAGTLTVGGTISAGTLSLTKAGAGTLNFGALPVTLNSLLINAGTLLSTSGTLSIAADLTNSGSFTHNSGTVTFNGTGAQSINSGGSSFNNFIITNTAGTCTAVTSNITVAGTFTTTASSTLDMGTNTLSVATVSHAGTLKTQNTSATPITAAKTWGGTVQYNSASAQTIINGNYNNLNGTGGNRTLNSAGTIGIAGVFTVGVGTYTVTGSTVDFNGTASQNIPAFNFNNLIISGNKGAGNLTFINGGTIGVAGTFSVTATNVTYIVTNNTFDYNGSGAQNINNNTSPFATYSNLIISNAGTKTIVTATNITCLTFTINGAAALDMPGTATLTVTQ